MKSDKKDDFARTSDKEYDTQIETATTMVRKIEQSDEVKEVS